MTISDMFGQSAVLAFLGMAVVFGFLALLIICITILGKVLHALGLDKEEPAKTAAPVSGGQSNGNVVAAITAAVKKYRNEN